MVYGGILIDKEDSLENFNNLNILSSCLYRFDLKNSLVIIGNCDLEPLIDSKPYVNTDKALPYLLLIVIASPDLEHPT